MNFRSGKGRIAPTTRTSTIRQRWRRIQERPRQASSSPKHCDAKTQGRGQSPAPSFSTITGLPASPYIHGRLSDRRIFKLSVPLDTLTGVIDIIATVRARSSAGVEEEVAGSLRDSVTLNGASQSGMIRHRVHAGRRLLRLQRARPRSLHGKDFHRSHQLRREITSRVIAEPETNYRNRQSTTEQVSHRFLDRHRQPRAQPVASICARAPLHSSYLRSVLSQNARASAATTGARSRYRF